MADVGVEEHHVAGLQSGAGNRLALVVLGVGAVGQGNAVVTVNLHGQARAVRAGPAGTAVHIRYAQEGVSVIHHSVAQGAAAGHHAGAKAFGRSSVAPCLDLRLGAHGVGAVIVLIGYRCADVGGDIAAAITERDQIPPACRVDVLELGHLAGFYGVVCGGDPGIGIHSCAAAELHTVILRQQGKVPGQLLPSGLLSQKLCRHLVQRHKLQLGNGFFLPGLRQIVGIQPLHTVPTGVEACLQADLFQSSHGLPIIQFCRLTNRCTIRISDGRCGDENGQSQTNAADPSGHIKTPFLLAESWRMPVN